MARYFYVLTVLVGCLGTAGMTAELTANGGPDAGNVLAGGRSPDMAISQHKLPCSGAQCSTKHLEVDNGIYKMSISRKIASLDCMDALRSALFLPLENASTSIYWDATGKPTEGTPGSVMLWLGNFDLCESAPHGRYCLADLQVSQTPALPYPINNQSTTLLRWGLCAVVICNSSVIKEHMMEILTETLHLQGAIPIDSFQVHCETSRPVSAGLQATLAFFGCLLGLVILGTAADLAHKYKVSHHPKLIYRIDTSGSHLVCPDGTPDENTPLIPPVATPGGSGDPWSIQAAPEEEWNRPPDALRLRRGLKQEPGRLIKFSQCFSLVSNLQEVFRIDVVQPNVRCLYSVRVLSSMWVVLGQAMLALYTSQLADNSVVLGQYTTRFSWQVVPSTFLAGDTFFFLSGLLVAYVSLQHMEKRNGRLSLLRFYFRRYIRLTPLMLGVLLLWLYVVPHLGSGPTWYQAQAKPSCFQYWWTNLLYIHNFYPVHYSQICMSWTWYLALDAQFYMFSPILLHALYRSFKNGVVAAVVMVAMSLLTTASLIAYFNISVNLPASMLADNQQALDDYQSILFDKPYVRVPPYIVGMVTGYLVQRNPSTPTLTQKSKMKVLLMWMVVTAVCFFLVYGLFPTFRGFPLGLAGNLIYGTLSHTCWALALAWVVYACHRGYGGVVGGLLSWHGWVPLSRVTYAVYLIHPVVIHVYNCSLKTPVHISDYYIGLYYCGLLLVSYVVALVLTLVVEQPLISMGRCLRQKRRSMEEAE